MMECTKNSILGIDIVNDSIQGFQANVTNGVNPFFVQNIFTLGCRMSLSDA